MVCKFLPLSGKFTAKFVAIVLAGHIYVAEISAAGACVENREN
jgi:hypothetical protein